MPVSERVGELSISEIQSHSGGKFYNFIDMKFSGRIPYYTVLLSISTTEFHFNTIVKLPTTKEYSFPSLVTTLTKGYPWHRG